MLVQVAIEQLQQELSASRREEEVFKEEARKVKPACILQYCSCRALSCVKCCPLL